MKYKILFDYGSYGGMAFADAPDFDNVEEAVQHAVAMNYATRFIIVSVHWEPKYVPTSPTL
jgi:hypothetical protein